jgi:hypothetical protein
VRPFVNPHVKPKQTFKIRQGTRNYNIRQEETEKDKRDERGRSNTNEVSEQEFIECLQINDLFEGDVDEGLVYLFIYLVILFIYLFNFIL